MTSRAIVAAAVVATIAFISFQALYYRDELLVDLSRIIIAIGISLVGLWALRIMDARHGAARRRDTNEVPTRDPVVVNQLWFLIPSLVMSCLCLTLWWATPGLVGFVLLLLLPATTLAGLFGGLRKRGLASPNAIALVLGNVLSVASLVGFEMALDALDPKPSWSALASWYDTARAGALVLVVGCVSFVLPGLLAHIKPRRGQRHLQDA